MSDFSDEEEYLVRVRAQVMMRDDSTGGWVPLGGGGLSVVAVRKLKLAQIDCQYACLHEYLIIGRRISDDHDVLSCTIKRDFEYNRVMPTFHHWRTGNKKFGLTFQTAADARTFDKGISSAVEDLLDGGVKGRGPLQINLDVGEGEVFMMLDLPLDRDSTRPSSPNTRSPSHSTSPRSPLSPPPLYETSPLRLQSPSTSARVTPTHSSPINRADTPTSVHRGDTPLVRELDSERLLTRARTLGGCTRVRGSGLPPGDPPPPGDNIYEWLHQLPPFKTSSSAPLNGGGVGGGGSAPSDKFYVISDVYDKDSFSDTYVRFDIKDQDPQYHYPHLESISSTVPLKTGGRRSSFSTLKRQAIGLGLEETFTFQGKEKGKKGKKGKKVGGVRVQHQRCAHCQELYTQSENRRGSCSYSPDPVRQGIDCISCLSCAKCLLYHCHYEDESFSEEEICTCTDTDGHLAKRWLGLSLLAVLVPCLCLYPVLTACYSCGRACHMCGGKHVPV